MAPNVEGEIAAAGLAAPNMKGAMDGAELVLADPKVKPAVAAVKGATTVAALVKGDGATLALAAA